MAGLGVVVLLVRHIGAGQVLDLFGRVGWRFAVAAGIYTASIGVRAAALWRTVLTRRVRYSDVLRIRFAGEAVEMLTFTGPFLAEPAKGWLLTRRGMSTADAFAAVVTEYLLYTVVSAVLQMAALLLLLARGAVPHDLRAAAVIVLILSAAFLAAFSFAAITGIGLLVPILRASRVLIGARRADRAARDFGRVEEGILTFLHAHPVRLAEVFAIEAAAQLLLVVEIAVVFGALGFPVSWPDALVVEGGGKFAAIAFAFVPGQVGIAEGLYVWLSGAIGIPVAAGLTLALVRRVRALAVAAVGVFAMFETRTS